MFLYLYILILKYFYNNICIIINPIKMNGSNFSSSFNPPDFLIPTALHLKKSIVFDSKTTKESKAKPHQMESNSSKASRTNWNVMTDKSGKCMFCGEIAIPGDSVCYQCNPG